MSVLGRLGDAVAVRSLVASRKPDFLRCSTNLLRYCLQVRATHNNEHRNEGFPLWALLDTLHCPSPLVSGDRKEFKR